MENQKETIKEEMDWSESHGAIQNEQGEWEMVLIDKLPKCKKCNDTGSYKIPVSSPIMAPYGLDDTTSVPCECKLRKLPKPHFSYSQLSALEWSVNRYIESYIYCKHQDSPELRLGKELATALEFRERKAPDYIEALKPKMPGYQFREYKVSAKLDRTPLIGILDGWDDIKWHIGEYKTGKKANLSKWKDQMVFYHLLFWQKYKKLPNKTNLYWAITKYNDDGQLIFTGEVQEFEINIIMKDVINIIPRITNAIDKIQRLVKEEEMKFGILPCFKKNIE
jgi:hypothetical protein